MTHLGKKKNLSPKFAFAFSLFPRVLLYLLGKQRGEASLYKNALATSKGFDFAGGSVL